VARLRDEVFDVLARGLARAVNDRVALGRELGTERLADVSRADHGDLRGKGRSLQQRGEHEPGRRGRRMNAHDEFPLVDISIVWRLRRDSPFV
jgi:hypothetical protein